MYTNFSHFTLANHEAAIWNSHTCAKHICLRAFVVDGLDGILYGFLIVMPVKRGLVAPQNIFIQTIIKKFEGSRKFVKLSLHIDGSIFYFY